MIERVTAMPKAKMIFKTPKYSADNRSPIIRLRPEVASRLYEIVEQSGLTPSAVI